MDEKYRPVFSRKNSIDCHAPAREKSEGQSVVDPKIEITCGPIEGQNRRRVVATLGPLQHVDRFDVCQQFVRAKWRESTIGKLGLGDDAHEFLDAEVLRVAAAQDDDSTSAWQPSVASLDTIAAKQTDWLWDQYLPAGAITVLDGDPGLGKSQLTIDIAARLSRGDAMPPGAAPDGTYKPRGTLILNAEDDPARTLRPRLDAAGAELSRIHLLREMNLPDGEEARPVSLPGDLPAIEATIDQNDIGLVVIDPWVAYLDGKLSMNNDADVRRCLGQVAAMAEQTGAAVLLVRHLNKKVGLNAKYRGGGSIGITGAARAVFMVGEDPADSDSRIMACVKSNLAPEPQSLRFRIESAGTTSRVRWGEACDITASDMLGAGKQSRGGKLEKAKDIISDILQGGGRGSNEVMAACTSEGISERTYHTARKKLGVLSEKTEFKGQWLLTLPSQNGSVF